jgi:hypothetical protein
MQVPKGFIRQRSTIVKFFDIYDRHVKLQLDLGFPAIGRWEPKTKEFPMSTVSSPLHFRELKAASVYYEILGCNPSNLQAVSPEARFEKNVDDTMVYYRVTANGSYVRADNTRGEFVKMTTDDGADVFLHYSQVFGPTAAARRRMNTLTYVLGVTYQNAARQMATLNDLINEAAALNEAMRKFNDIYYSFATNAINYDSGMTNQILRISSELLKIYIDNGLQIPLNRICGGAAPQLYAEIRHHTESYSQKFYLDWKIFYIDSSSNQHTVFTRNDIDYGDGGENSIPPPAYTLNEYLGSLGGMMNDEAAMRAQFSTTAKYTITSVVNEKFYAICSFESSGAMKYDYLLGLSDQNAKNLSKSPDRARIVAATKEVDVSASCYSRPVSLDEVLNANQNGYFRQVEANAFLDQIRITIDQLSNELSGVSTMIGVHNQEMQHGYGVATATVEASEEAQQKTARNIR